MSTVETRGVRLRYAVAGEGEPVVFVNDAGFGAWLWSHLQPALVGPYRTVVWDLRGTGESDTPGGPYALETLLEDLGAVISAIDERRVHLVGAGLGGVIALEYAREHDHVASLTVLGTAEGDAVDADALASLTAPADDPDALRESLEAAFAPGVLEAHPEEIDRIVEWRARDDADPDGWAAQRAAWLGADLPDRYEITTPALVVSGAEDRIVDPTATARLAEELPRGEHLPLEGGHLFPVSESQVVADELLAWLDERTD
ncbi:alpha/beta fold hydrolase [Halorhabdus amylolytica]|uniref:alpha/beta fold hydrolase n=1 Tax=Halorhabdus amylolytica TaxID=2559573 RepID=UPI0010AA172D|nr:alpha/beta hydrolase [Halorhabdus amylolytica]